MSSVGGEAVGAGEAKDGDDVAGGEGKRGGGGEEKVSARARARTESKVSVADEEAAEEARDERRRLRRLRRFAQQCHRYKVCPAPPPAPPEEVNPWQQVFSFYAFDLAVPHATRYRVLRNNAPLERYKVALDGVHSGRETVHTFYAFDMPVPGTSRYYVSVARDPERYQIGSEDALKPWSRLYAFYAYSARRVDEYDWAFYEDLGQWGSRAKARAPLLCDREEKASDAGGSDDEGGSGGSDSEASSDDELSPEEAAAAAAAAAAAEAEATEAAAAEQDEITALIAQLKIEGHSDEDIAALLAGEG